MDNTPDFVSKDGNIEYTDWVVGVYSGNPSCMYRIVRAVKQKGKISWEYADGLGELEDLFDIASPESWIPFLV